MQRSSMRPPRCRRGSLRHCRHCATERSRWQHARVIVEQTSDLGDDAGDACARLDELLAELSVSNTAATVRRKARHLREQVMTETIAERHRTARAKRRVEFEPRPTAWPGCTRSCPPMTPRSSSTGSIGFARAATRARTVAQTPTRSAMSHPTTHPAAHECVHDDRHVPTDRLRRRAAHGRPGACRRRARPAALRQPRLRVGAGRRGRAGASERARHRSGAHAHRRVRGSRPARRVRPDRRRHGAAARRAGTIVHPHTDPPGVGHRARRRPRAAIGLRPIS